jgi:sulfur transfer complex TusBCD TusB component (DsrH family)
MTTLEDLEQPPPVQFARLPDELQAPKLASPKQSITLEQGQSVVLVADGVTVKVANNKFHSLKATTFVLVKFAARVDDAEQPQDAQQVEPTVVGSAITCNGKTLALVSAIDSKSKRLTIDLVDGVQVQNNSI